LDEREAYLRAGLIASKVKEEVRSRVKVGASILEICEFVERRIRELGGEPAFPCNVGVNHIAAHYTSPPGDPKTIPDGALVKVDLGVHVDGYIADTAFTVSFNPELEPLVEAVETALDAAVEAARAGVRVSSIGAIIEAKIRGMGFKPIRNLTGHGLARYTIHSGEVIPNVPTGHRGRLKEGRAYAIEPFATTRSGHGEVAGAPERYIFRLVKLKRIGGMAGEMLEYINERFKTLPFSERWLVERFPQGRTEALSTLLRSKALMAYQVLVERSLRPVAQAEHTIIVERDGCIVIT